MVHARTGGGLPGLSDSTGRFSLNGRDQQGFSLIELIVIVGIIAILVLFSIPNFTEWRNNQNLKAAAREVFSAFQFARLEAARRDAKVTFRVTTGAGGIGKCTVFVDDPGPADVNRLTKRDNGVLDPGEPLLRQMTVPKGITLSSSDLPTYKLTSRGFTDGAGGSIILNNGKTKYTVTLSAAGVVQLDGPKQWP